LKIVDGVPELGNGEELSGKFDRTRKGRIEAAIRNISPAAFKVWFVIGDFCRPNAIAHWRTNAKGQREQIGTSEGCFPAVSSIAKRAGMSDRHVQTCLKELVEKGWLKFTRRPPRRTNLYWMPRGFPSSRRWYALAILGHGDYPEQDDEEVG
jgi:hypothetical protein